MTAPVALPVDADRCRATGEREGRCTEPAHEPSEYELTSGVVVHKVRVGGGFYLFGTPVAVEVEK